MINELFWETGSYDSFCLDFFFWLNRLFKIWAGMGDAHGFNSASIRLEADEFREWTPYETVFNNSVRNLVLECIFIGIHLIIGHFFLKWDQL